MSIGQSEITQTQILFGKNLKKLREDKGMSQLDLAVQANLEKTAISRIENGRTNVTLKTALIISKALDLELHLLFVFDCIEQKKGV